MGTGLGATLLSVGIALWFCAAWHGTRVFAGLRRLLAPLLALPHAAFAIGFAFLIAPSGWLVRLLSPWATWLDPAARSCDRQRSDGSGAGVRTGGQGGAVSAADDRRGAQSGAGGPNADCRADHGVRAGHGLEQDGAAAGYPQLRLPVYAVLAFSASVVDMALILGPGAPPTLAVLVLRWFSDPDLAMRYQAAAGACLQLILAGALIALWRLGEVVAGRAGRRWAVSGGRGGTGTLARLVSAGLAAGVVAVATGASVGLGLWSVAERWRYPDALPAAWSWETWIGRCLNWRVPPGRH